MYPRSLFPAALFPPPLYPPAAGVYYDVLEAVQAYFRSRPDLQAATSDGLLWAVEADQDVQLPYAFCFLASEVDDVVTTGAYKVVRSVVQVNCCDATLRGAADLRRRVEAAYDGAPLAVCGLPVRLCFPSGPAAAKGEGKGPGGEDWFVASVGLEVLWDQPKPVPFRP